GVQLVLEPPGGGPEAPVLGEPLGELAGGVVGGEIPEGPLLFLREEAACFQLEQGGDEDEKLAVDLEVAAPLLQEREHDLDDFDVGELELFLQDERQKEDERPLDRMKVERKLSDGAHRPNSMVSGGRGLSAQSSSAPAAGRWASGAPRSRADAATTVTPP